MTAGHACREVTGGAGLWSGTLSVLSRTVSAAAMAETLPEGRVSGPLYGRHGNYEWAFASSPLALGLVPSALAVAFFGYAAVFYRSCGHLPRSEPEGLSDAGMRAFFCRRCTVPRLDRTM